MIYFDATYLARMYFQDPGWQTVCELAATDKVSCSLHGRVETVAALHRKFREGSLTKSELATTLAGFEADCAAGAFHWIPVAASVVERVTRAYSTLPANIALRAADALHLASAAESGFKTIYSNDTRLLASASHFGISGQNVI